VVRDRIFAALGGRYDVVTGQQLAAQEAQDVYNGFIKFIGTALLIFAGVALFVGTFIISNTFSIIVAGRTRELALLRALGAGRRQIMTSVLAEALVTGVVSSLVGVAFGILVASGLKAVLAAFGGKLPSSATVVAARTIVVSVVLGVVVTLASALLPAVRATRIPPIAALRGEGLPGAGTRGVRRARLVVGSLFLALGLGLLAQGLVFGGGAVRVGLGAAAFIVGVAVLAVLVARTLARIIGAPLARAFKLPGRLAQQNAMRNPARTSATAAALMIGLALVTFVSVFAASIKASLAASFDRSFAADYVIISNSFEGFSAAIGDDLRRVPEVGAVATVSGGQFRLEGKTTDLSASPLATYASLIKLQLVDGRVPADNAGGLLVLDKTAEDHGWKVGDSVPMEFARTGVQQIPVAATFKRNDFAGKFMLSTVDYSRNFLSNQAEVVVVKAAPGVPAATSRAAIEPVLERYPNTSLRDQAQYKDKVTSSVNQILGLVTVLLLLAIVIAVIGIVNTLALSVLERTRELGLLRAVGMSRRQTRRMIRWESVIIAVIGATLGLLVGVFFGWALVRAIHDEGITELSIPVGQLLTYVLAAALFGVVAAILPARRAAKLNVLAAIAYE
jgi:putative ABC transport system permease protein